MPLVRTISLEIYKFCDGDQSRREAWKDLAKTVQQATNALWRLWISYHTLAQTDELIRKEFEQYQKWKSGDKRFKKKPEFTSDPFPRTDKTPGWHLFSRKKMPRKGKTNPPDLQNDLYHAIHRMYPELTTRTVTLIIQKWARTVRTRKAASGNLAGWKSILFGNEGMPSFTRPVPIPFDKKSSPKSTPLKKVKNANGYDDYVLSIGIQRGPENIRYEECVLMLKRAKTRTMQVTCDRIMSGQYEFKGSSLHMDRGKWFVLISYELPEVKREDLDPTKVLWVRPGRNVPWRFAIGEPLDSRTLGDRHNVVGLARRRLIAQRRSRQAHYKFAAGSNATGHGRKRATLPWTKFDRNWKGFTKQYNRNIVKRLVDIALQEGCGTIVYLQPTGAVASHRYLSTAGNDAEFGTRSSWDYFQFGNYLESSAEKQGIHVGRGDIPKEAEQPKRRWKKTGELIPLKTDAKVGGGSGRKKPDAKRRSTSRTDAKRTKKDASMRKANSKKGRSKK